MPKKITKIESFVDYVIESVIPKAKNRYYSKLKLGRAESAISEIDLSAAATAAFFFFALRTIFSESADRNSKMQVLGSALSARVPDLGVRREVFKLWVDRIVEYSLAHPSENPHQTVFDCLRLFLCPSIPQSSDNPCEDMLLYLGSFLMVCSENGEFVP